MVAKTYPANRAVDRLTLVYAKREEFPFAAEELVFDHASVSGRRDRGHNRPGERNGNRRLEMKRVRNRDDAIRGMTRGARGIAKGDLVAGLYRRKEEPDQLARCLFILNARGGR